MGFDPRQADFKASAYTCWHSSSCYSSIIGFLLPASNDLCIVTSPGILGTGFHLMEHQIVKTSSFVFWKPHFFVFVFRAQHSPCFPLNSLWPLSHICKLLLSCMLGASLLPYTLSQIFSYQLHSKNCQVFVLIIWPEIYWLVWYLKTNISLT